MSGTPIDAVRLDQLNQYSIIERVCSVLSLLGSVFIIATFCYSNMFHKPINRLVFFASFGNMMTNVGTLMARSYVGDTDGAGCQFQAFLIQMFLPADTLWTLAMAVNVYLTFYHKFDAVKLRKMEIPYLFICYGLPFVIALTYVFIQSPERGRMYGDATLWCWISPRWDIWRLTTFYGPIWLIILVTFFIYIRAGGEIYRKHQQLRNFHSSTRSHHEPEPLPPMDDPLVSSKTTEVSITSEAVMPAVPGAIDLAPLGRRASDNAQQAPPPIPGPAYSVQISSTGTNTNDRRPSHHPELTIQPTRATLTRTTTRIGAIQQRSRANQDATNAAWSYTKCALLFFTAMLVTWLPSSANRVYSVIHANQVNLTLEYMSAFVLPLQGFWNAVIYIVTSWKACKLVFHDIFLSRMPVTELIDYRSSIIRRRQQSSNNRQSQAAGAGTGVAGSSHSRKESGSAGRITPQPSDKNYENESMTDLASRPSLQEPGQERRPHRGV
ncbi:G-protein coupled receptor [Pyricularia oryzae Y34]|nr:G-protein coupled receptor [Pyricularia oryzae Y34]